MKLLENKNVIDFDSFEYGLADEDLSIRSVILGGKNVILETNLLINPFFVSVFEKK